MVFRHRSNATKAQLRETVARLEAQIAELQQGRERDTHIAAIEQDSLITYLQDAVVISDLGFHIQGWNDAAARLYGWSADEALGRRVGEVTPTLRYLNDESTETARTALMRDGAWRGDIAQLHRDGHELMVSSMVQTLRDAAGAPVAYVAINRDMSPQLAAEAALRRYAERLRILHAISQMTLAGNALDTIAGAALDQLLALVPAQRMSVLLYSEDMRSGTFLGISGSLPHGPHIGATVDLGAIQADELGARSEPLIIPDLRAPFDPAGPAIPELLHKRLLGQGVRSSVTIPLRADSTLIGLLNLLSTTPDAFSDDQVAIAREVGGYLALAIQSSRLRENEGRARQIAETLHRAGMALTRSLELNQVLEALLDHLQELVPYDSANVMLLRDSWFFQVYSMRGYQHRADPEQIRTISFDARDHAITGEILRTRRSLLISDTHNHPGWVEVARGEEIRSWMGIPIISRGEILGIYAVNKTTPGFFTADSVVLAETLATVAAAAIANALLYAQAQQELADRRRAEADLEAERAQLARRVAERTADLSAANVELARASRLKDEFLANMSHELRTPLNTVLGRAEILREQIYGPLTDQQQRAITSIDESGRHLLALINDILDLSKIEAGKLDLQIAKVDVSGLCQACLRMVAQAAIVKGISLTSTFDMAVESMQADERRLKQILVNLLSNAVKFTSNGGRVSLEVRGHRAHGAIEFIVADTGIGIAEADLPRLFLPFVQIDAGLSRQHDGTGLGLSLVKRLAGAHGGGVAVESSPGQGSRFIVTLPWADEVPQLAPDPSELAMLPLSRVLIVDDSQAATEQLSRYLADLGCAVSVHERAEGALDLAAALGPDLLVLDVLLPDQTGWAVLRQVRSDPRTAHIPVLVVSVVDEPELARQLGADGHLLKPIVRADLMRSLRQLRRRAADPAPAPERIPALRGERKILLAEDNEDNISLLMDFLPLQGYDLVVARNGRDAIELARELRPTVILMDIQMPVMDGIEATRHIRADAELRGIPVIALTALAMPGDRDRCLAAGADAYVVKPVSLRELPGQIEDAIQRRAAAA